MENSSPARNTPEDDLALVAQVQNSLEPPRRFSLTYDVLYSLTCGVFVGGQALPTTARLYVYFVVGFSLLALVLWWRRRLGWWLSGYAPRRARWVAVAMIVPLAGLAMWAGLAQEPWVAITAGVAATVVAFVFSRLWAHVWRQERAAATRAR